MQVTRSGKVETTALDQATVYQLRLPNNKTIAIGDRAFFDPATQALLDQAATEKLTTKITGQMLIFSDQGAVFTLPLAGVEVPGHGTPQKTPLSSADPAQSAPQEGLQRFKNARLTPNSPALSAALDKYAFFASHAWRLLDPNQAEFRGEIALSAYKPSDSRFMRHLNTQDLTAIFKSVAFVTDISLSPDGSAECKNTAFQALFQDGSQTQAAPSENTSSLFDRISRNRKLKLDPILLQAAANPHYGATPSQTGQ
jgi:hypothetical protein